MFVTFSPAFLNHHHPLLFSEMASSDSYSYSKRKKSSGDLLDGDRSKKPKVERERAPLFGDCRFYLHPAALGKSRRAIFERQIRRHGGELEATLGGTATTKDTSLPSSLSSSSPLVVLLEDTLSEGARVKALAEKLARENPQEGRMEIVGLSWVSKCLEEGAAVSRQGFVIEVASAAVNKKPAPSPSKPDGSGNKGGSGEEEEEQQARASSYIERNKHKFVCARSSDAPSSESPNKDITDELEKLAAAYKSSNDTWR